MKFNEIFGNAKWIGAKEKEISPIIRASFILSEAPTGVRINIVGFGGYLLYVNGQRASEDYYLPLSSDFEPRDNFPVDEVLAHRIYADSFDITHLLKKGKNTVAVIIGEGWYTLPERNKPYGDKKLVFRVFDESGDLILSDTAAKYTESFVKDCYFVTHETQDYTDYSDAFLLSDYDDSAWENAVEAKIPVSEYYFSDCPRDRISKKITPVAVEAVNGAIIYDTGENISGFPVFKAKKAGETVTVIFSEELDETGGLDMKHHHRQKFTFTAEREGRIAAPAFVWYGFRYFSVSRDAEVLSVYKIHSDVKTDSAFDSDNELLNWIYKTFLNTQLCNMHAGVPSDCPHIERKGYTGDGQLCAHAVMLTLDSRSFYKKWIQDISDCQDRKSGHVQYTAPYTQNGGGPGGWGTAIINVPYDYYLRYGDISEAERLYPQMLRYFDYLDAHSENLLVTSDKEGAWCLGEWCTPGPLGVAETIIEGANGECFTPGTVILPAPFVNNYFYVKGLMKVIEIAKLIGKREDVPMLEKKLIERREALRAAYFNTWDANFIGCQQGSNAFALDIGLGTPSTKKHLINHYKNNKYYDTGIFGTEIVTRLLFEYGEAETAFDLLTSEVPGHSFGYWKNTGATSFREYWGFARSYSHPMFGAVVAHFFDYILGITQEKDSAGYEKLVIKPALIKKLTRASGYINVKEGKVEVSYEIKDGEFILNVSLPETKEARVILPDGTEENITGSAVLKCSI